MTYNFHNANGWCNNYSHKCFAGNQLSKTTPFIGSPQAIIYQLSSRHSTQYINYHCKKNLFYYCYLYLLFNTVSFLHKAITLKPVFIPKDTDTHAYAMVVKRWWQKPAKQPTFGPVSFITCLLNSNPIQQYNVFLLANFFGRVKEANNITTLVGRFF